MPKINQLNSKTVPSNNDEFPFHDPNSGTTRKITRGDLIGGAPLPANSVNGQALQAGSVTPDKTSGGYWLINHVFANSTGTQTITGVPFRPKAILINYGNASTTGSAIVSSGRASDNSGSVVQSSESIAIAGSTSSTTTSTSNSFVRPATDGNPVFIGSVGSFTNDGITVNVSLSSSSAAARTFSIMFFG